MQRDTLHDNHIKEELDNAVKRVMAISLIHNKLYKSKELSSIRFDKYVEQLIEEICSFHEGTTDIEYQLNIDVTSMEINNMIPLGLIINELVTNSIKHSNDAGKKVKIYIAFTEITSGSIQFDYQDNGEWIESSDLGLGLELIESLNEQLEGSLERIGTKYCLKFKG